MPRPHLMVVVVRCVYGDLKGRMICSRAGLNDWTAPQQGTCALKDSPFSLGGFILTVTWVLSAVQ